MSMPSTRLIVRSVSRGPPIAYVWLILSLVTPPLGSGICTLRSRGIDITAVASLLGSSRTRIIVSELPRIPRRRSATRLSEPSSSSVCGAPASAGVITSATFRR